MAETDKNILRGKIDRVPDYLERPLRLLRQDFITALHELTAKINSGKIAAHHQYMHVPISAPNINTQARKALRAFQVFWVRNIIEFNGYLPKEMLDDFIECLGSDVCRLDKEDVLPLFSIINGHYNKSFIEGNEIDPFAKHLAMHTYNSKDMQNVGSGIIMHFVPWFVTSINAIVADFFGDHDRASEIKEAIKHPIKDSNI